MEIRAATFGQKGGGIPEDQNGQSQGLPIPASLYALEDSKTFTAKGSFQHVCEESCYISFRLPVPSRNKDFRASLYFTADLKYGTMTTNILTLQLIFEIYCMPGTSLSVLESLILKIIL